MEADRAFERIRDLALNERLEALDREFFKKSLNYLREQARVDMERRHSAVGVRATWGKIVKAAAKSEILMVLQADAAWKIADLFCDPTRQLNAPPPPKTSVAVADEKELLAKLLKAVTTDARIEIKDRWLLHLALRVLCHESRLAKTERDQKFLLPLWRHIWPLLDKYELLQPYASQKLVRDQLNFFLRGHFGGSAPAPKRTRRGTPDHDYTGKQDIHPENLPAKP